MARAVGGKLGHGVVGESWNRDRKEKVGHSPEFCWTVKENEN